METSPEKFFAQYHREPGLPEGVLRCTLFLKSIGIIVGIISGHRVCGIEIGGFRIGSTCCEPLRKEIWWRKVETEGNQWYPISLLQERSTYEESLFLPFFFWKLIFSLFLFLFLFLLSDRSLFFYQQSTEWLLLQNWWNNICERQQYPPSAILSSKMSKEWPNHSKLGNDVHFLVENHN